MKKKPGDTYLRQQNELETQTQQTRANNRPIGDPQEAGRTGQANKKTAQNMRRGHSDYRGSASSGWAPFPECSGWGRGSKNVHVRTYAQAGCF